MRKDLLEGCAQREEEGVGAAVAHADGAQASVQLVGAVEFGDGLEDVPGVAVVAVVLLHLEEGLHALEGREQGLGEAGQATRDTCDQDVASGGMHLFDQVGVGRFAEAFE